MGFSIISHPAMGYPYIIETHDKKTIIIDYEPLWNPLQSINYPFMEPLF